MLSNYTFFLIYAVLGFLLLLFNKWITYFFYNLILVFTDKVQIDHLFLFKIDNNNKNSMIFLMRAFIITFSLCILLFSLYNIIY